MAAALVGGGYLYYRLDDEIRRQVERTFANHYRHLDVQVAKARYEQGQGITVSGLAIGEPRAGGAAEPILAIDELFLACDMSMEEMASGKPNLRRIVVRRPRLRAIRLADGSWNVATLVPLPKLSDQSPEMEIDDATLILEDATRHDVAPLALRGVDLKLTPVDAAATSPANACPRFAITGTSTGSPAKQLKFTGTAGCTDGTLELTVEVRGLDVSPELVAAIPGPRSPQLANCEFFGTADATVRLTRAAATQPIHWSAAVTVSRGRLNHPQLPLPMSEIVATVAADPRRLLVEQLRAKCGTADVVLACERSGWKAGAPLGLAGRVVGLTIDPLVTAKLPPRVQRVLQRFQPVGIADADVRLTFDGQRWRPELTAHCRGMSLTDLEKFPYPLEQVSGTVKVTGSPTRDGDLLLALDLTGHGNGQPIKIAAQLDQIPLEASAAATVERLPATPTSEARPKPIGWIEVSGTGVAIHEQLLAALPTEKFNVQALVRSLHPKGPVNFRWRYDRDDAFAEAANTSLDLALVDCAIVYDRFPYPLERIHGMVISRNSEWTLKDLESRDRHGLAVITCNGQTQMTPAGNELRLVFNGTGVLLDEDLKQALEPQVQEVWTQLRPQGRVDFISNVLRRPNLDKPEILVELRPHGDTVSVEPTFFPYRLEQVAGRALVSTGRVELHNMQAKHGRSTFAAQGNWQATPDGGWQLALSNLNADRLSFDPDLMRALPPGVQKVVERLRPAGTFDLYTSSLGFVRRPESTQIASTWDVQLACHQAALRGDLPLENLTGGIRVLGANDVNTCQSYGELKIDSLIWNDVQFTNIRGPFWSDSTYCVLGRHASERLGRPAQRVTADLYGGSIATDIQLQHTGQTRYTAESSLAAIDLGRLARERLGGPADMTGMVSGTLSLAGAGRSTSALKGRGNLQIVDANIYQLPPLVALLKVLRNRTPNSTAFDRCEMQFDVSGEHIHFHQLNLLGDAMSLYGRGETNFDRQLKLVFYTLVGPADLPIPLWNTIAGQLSQQGLQVKVDGTWDDPQIHREAFPAVAQMLEQIRTEAQQSAVLPTPPPLR